MPAQLRSGRAAPDQSRAGKQALNYVMFIWMPRCDMPTRSGRMKWKFRSELAALMVAHGFTRGSNRVLYVYDCPHCNGWHTTNKEQT